MMKLLALTSALLFSACVAESEGPTDLGTDPAGSDPTDTTTADTAADAPDTIARMPQEASTDRGADNCDLLPDSGPCSFACDPEYMISQFVPKGTCAVISCKLTNGVTFNAGGCNQ